MNKMWKDRFGSVGGFIVTSLFLAGSAASAWSLFNLGSSLVSDGGLPDLKQAGPVLNQHYIILGITIAVGLVSIVFHFYHKREVLVYKERRNEVIQQANQVTTQFNKEIGPLKAMISGSNNKEIFAQGLQALAKFLDAVIGAAYLTKNDGENRVLEFECGFAWSASDDEQLQFKFGEGLVGQVAVSGKMVYIDDIPEGYMKVISGLGTASPSFLLIIPVVNLQQVLGVMEIATFSPVTENQRNLAYDLVKFIADKLNGI